MLGMGETGVTYFFVSNDNMLSWCFKSAHGIESFLRPRDTGPNQGTGKSIQNQILGASAHGLGDIIKLQASNPATELTGDASVGIVRGGLLGLCMSFFINTVGDGRWGSRRCRLGLYCNDDHCELFDREKDVGKKQGERDWRHRSI